MLNGFSPLRHRDFAIYWVAQLTSNVGTQMEATATTWLLYRLTDSPTILGLAGLARALPILLFTLFGGTLADRIGQRAILYFTQTSFTVLSVVTGALVLTGQIQAWQLIVNGALNGALLAFDAPARQSLYPLLIPPEDLPRAVPLNSGIRYLSIVAGPAIGGIVVAAFGPTPAYFGNAVTYFALLGALPVLRIRAAQRLVRGALLRQTAEGLAYVVRTPILASTIGLLVILASFGQNPALMTVYSSDILHAGAEGLGVLLSAVGAGAVAGGLLLLTVFTGVRRIGRMFVGAGLVSAAALVVFAFSREFAVSVAAAFVMGMCQATWGALGNTMVQIAAPLHLRGRVLSVHVLVTRAFDYVSGFQSGMLIGWLTPVPAVLVSAGVMAAMLAAVGIRGRSLAGFLLERDASDGRTLGLAVNATAPSSRGRR